MENDVTITISVEMEKALNDLKIFSNTLSSMSKDFNSSVKDLSAGMGNVNSAMGSVASGSHKIRKIFIDDFTKMKKSVKEIDFWEMRENMDKLLSPNAADFARDLSKVDTTGADMTLDNMEAIKEYLGILQLPMSEFERQLTLQGKTLSENGEVFDVFSGKMLDWKLEMQKANSMAKKFNFSLLSVMFAGMALDRVFGSILRTQLQLFGVTELMSSAWTVTMLPIMELITPILYDLIDAFMNLPESAQLAIGGLVIFMTILGNVLSVVGQFGLGIQGIMMLFPKLGFAIANAGGVVKALGVFFAGFGVVTLAVIAAVVAIVIGMYLAFKENFLGMQRVVQLWVSGFKQAFSGLLNFFGGIWDMIKGLFTGNTDLIVSGFKRAFTGLWDFIIGGFKMMAGVIGAVLIGAIRIVVGPIQALINLIGRIPELWGGKKMWNIDWLNDLSVKGSFKTGGMVPETGNYLLHAGEEVIPKNEVGNNSSIVFSPVINITAGNQADGQLIGRLVSEELNRQWAYKFERLR